MPKTVPTNSSPKMMLRPPVIILGMHRSGTSMAAELLAKMGLFLGKDLAGHHESFFFQRRNELILNACNGGWDNPQAIAEIWHHPPTRARITALLRADLQSLHQLTFLGPGRYLKYRSACRLDFPWGWKDPRNSLLLPLWLEIFPEAKVIHLVRNGIDVAASLASREAKRLDAALPRNGRTITKVKNFAGRLRRGELPFKLFYNTCERIDRLTPLHQYREHCVHRCLSLDYGFELWAHYLQQADNWTAALPPAKILRLRYEDLLRSPAEHLRTLREFCGLTVAEPELAKMASNLRGDRAFAFRKRPELVAMYHRLKGHPLMRQTGYDAITLCESNA